jgi:hypothetical protein
VFTESTPRYLTKISDQIIVLLDQEHASEMQWKDSRADDDDDDSSDDDDGRLFSFEVSKSVEQEESVGTRPGFEVRYIPSISFVTNCWLNLGPGGNQTISAPSKLTDQSKHA